MAGFPAGGDMQGRVKRRRDTCIVGIAVLNASAVDALGFVPKRESAAGRRHCCMDPRVVADQTTLQAPGAALLK